MSTTVEQIERWRTEAKDQVCRLAATVPGVVLRWAFDNIDNVCDDLLQQARREETEQDDDRHDR